jgi:hypothetical protein
MVSIVALHRARVMCTGADKPHRQLNQVTGAVLAAIVVGLTARGEAR